MSVKIGPYKAELLKKFEGEAKRIREVLVGATLKGGGSNMPGSVARTDEGIKMLDDWLSGL